MTEPQGSEGQRWRVHCEDPLTLCDEPEHPDDWRHIYVVPESLLAVAEANFVAAAVRDHDKISSLREALRVAEQATRLNALAALNSERKREEAVELLELEGYCMTVGCSVDGHDHRAQRLAAEPKGKE